MGDISHWVFIQRWAGTGDYDSWDPPAVPGILGRLRQSLSGQVHEGRLLLRFATIPPLPLTFFVDGSSIAFSVLTCFG